MKVSEMQVGGDHYKAEYQHWDWAIDIELGYLESASTKYVTRWRGKNGAQDVEKAIHYLTKAKEAFCERRYHNQSLFMGDTRDIDKAIKKTRRFITANNIVGLEAEFMEAAASWKNESHLSLAIDIATRILAMAVEAVQGQAAAPGASTSGKASRGVADQKTGAAGRAGGTTTQAPASSASTGVGNSGRTEHPAPFGYEGDE